MGIFIVEIKKLIGTLYKGTYWCGPGNTAPNDDILGQFRDADACCRAHDKCPDIIDGKTTKYGLTNDHVFPRY